MVFFITVTAAAAARWKSFVDFPLSDRLPKQNYFHNIFINIRTYTYIHINDRNIYMQS